MMELIFGVDLGGTTVKLGAFDTQGTLLRKWEIPTRTENCGEHLLRDIADAVNAEAAARSAQVLGLGFGVPGTVRDGDYVQTCVNLGGWGGLRAGTALGGLCGCEETVVLNDANAAALGEQWRGGGAGTRNMVFVTLGTGVGGGVIVDGQLLVGAHGCGGEIGHIKLLPTGDDVCGCGKRGCLEKYASATALVAQAKRVLASDTDHSVLHDDKELTARAVFDAAKGGDALAEALCRDYADALGRGLAGVACVCDPEAFVLGGGVARAGEYLLSLTSEAFARYAYAETATVRFALAELGNDAGIYGCAHAILEKLARQRKFNV